MKHFTGVAIGIAGVCLFVFNNLEGAGIALMIAGFLHSLSKK